MPHESTPSNTPQHSTVRCRCGHQVLGRELLRAAPFEKASGRVMIYLKFRCRRCKKLGETCIPREDWHPGLFQTPKNEMGALERDRFLDEYAISSADVIAWSRALQKVNGIGDLHSPQPPRSKRSRKTEKTDSEKNAAEKSTEENRK